MLFSWVLYQKVVPSTLTFILVYSDIQYKIKNNWYQRWCQTLMCQRWLFAVKSTFSPSFKGYMLSLRGIFPAVILNLNNFEPLVVWTWNLLNFPLTCSDYFLREKNKNNNKKIKNIKFSQATVVRIVVKNLKIFLKSTKT